MKADGAEACGPADDDRLDRTSATGIIDSGLGRFVVVVDSGSLQRSSRGVVTGRVHVDLDGFRFPDAEWSDLVVAMLVGWLDALSEPGDGGPVSLRFLDGPFLLECEPAATGRWCVRCIAAGRERRVLREREVEHREIVSAVVGATRDVLAECTRRRWEPADLRRARALVARLEEPSDGGSSGG